MALWPFNVLSDCRVDYLSRSYCRRRIKGSIERIHCIMVT